MVNGEKVLTRQLITKWHERARIDYSDLYVRQYIAYNAWFRKVTDCNEDFEAIRRVLRRFIIWDDYLSGRTMPDLIPVIESISILTQKTPTRSLGTSWDGIVKDSMDWRGLIYFWYQTRCDLFHGLTIPEHTLHETRIRLAYESLNIFMGEIVRRMRYCFTDADLAKLTEVRTLLRSEKSTDVGLQEIEVKLYQKFIHSPDIWNVDMERV